MRIVSEQLEKRVFGKLLWFIMPAMLIAFMDRINISFAAPTMNKAIGIDPATFGTGAGIFFLGYLLFEIPSNLVLARIGARVWISRIMIVWGFVAAAMSFAVGPASFLSLRFLLGVAEAGFLPGVMLYASYWIAPARLGAFNSWMLLAIPLAGSVTALLSGAVLAMEGWLGLAGWQWIFVVEGVPAILLGLYGLIYLPSRPRDAAWLSDAEKEAVEQSTVSVSARPSARLNASSSTITNRRVWLFALAYLCLNCALGAQPWLPLLFAPFKLATFTIALILAVGNVLAAAGMVIWGRVSDRPAERPNHLLGSAALSGVGWFLCGFGEGSQLAVVLGVVLALVGLYASVVVFWAMPAASLRVEERPFGIALITCVGLVGSFTAPIITGWLKQSTGSYAGGMYLAVGGMALGAVIAVAAAKTSLELTGVREPRASI